jgi:hypothetical protein
LAGSGDLKNTPPTPNTLAMVFALQQGRSLRHSSVKKEIWG